MDVRHIVGQKQCRCDAAEVIVEVVVRLRSEVVVPITLHQAGTLQQCECKTIAGAGKRWVLRERRQDIKLQVSPQICLKLYARSEFPTGTADTFPASIPSISTQSAGYGVTRIARKREPFLPWLPWQYVRLMEPRGARSRRHRGIFSRTGLRVLWILKQRHTHP